MLHHQLKQATIARYGKKSEKHIDGVEQYNLFDEAVIPKETKTIEKK